MGFSRRKVIVKIRALWGVMAYITWYSRLVPKFRRAILALSSGFEVYK